MKVNKANKAQAQSPFDLQEDAEYFEDFLAGLLDAYTEGEAAEYLDDSYDLLGAGCFSRVIEYPWDDTKAVKVSLHGEDGSDGWLQWAEFCIRHKDERLSILPEIYELRVFSGMTVALLERYDGTLESWEDDFVYNSRVTIDDDSRSIVHKLCSIDKLFNDTITNDHIVAEAWREGLLDEMDAEVLRFQQLWLDEGEDRLSDLGRNNIMIHGNRLVITDPICGSGNEYAYELLHHLGVYVQDIVEEENDN